MTTGTAQLRWMHTAGGWATSYFRPCATVTNACLRGSNSSDHSSLGDRIYWGVRCWPDAASAAT